MLSSLISRSTAAFGGAPFRLKKCTALSSAAGGAAGGSVAGNLLELPICCLSFHYLELLVIIIVAGKFDFEC